MTSDTHVEASSYFFTRLDWIQYELKATVFVSEPFPEQRSKNWTV